MSARSLRKKVTGKSMSSVAASHAKTSATPERGPASLASGQVFGTSSLGSLATFDQGTSLWRTSQRCLLEGWVKYLGRWPRSGMTRSGTLFQLRPLVRRTGGTGSGSSRSIPTPRAFVGSVIANRVKVFAETGKPMRRKDGGEYHLTLEEYATVFPTPTADKCVASTLTPEMADRFRKKNRSGSFVEAMAATMWPTPLARDWRSGKASQATHDKNFRPLSEQIGGQLNPTWVEWLMGWPLGWSELKPLETGKSPCVPQPHGES